MKCHMTLAGPSATCLLADKHQVQTNAFALILLYANYIACLYFISNELFSKQTNIFKQRQNHSWGEFSSKVPIERVECTKKVEDHWCRVRFLFCHRTKSFLMIEKNCQFGHNVWKYRAMHIVTASFNTTMGQMTKTSMTKMSRHRNISWEWKKV